ncbi:MAG: hypothetical protein IBX62_01075 [Coriobacteriia bacterium]|nr:hypothetical protein [Coriobacteriia bacterium]
MSHTRLRPLTAAMLSLALALALTPAAVAQPAYAPVTDLDSRLLVDVGSSSGVVLVTATLPEETRLPAKVALPVPAGAKLLWTGEIVGVDPSKDPQRQYTVEKADGYDLVVFDLSESRVAQAEYESPPSASPGGAKTLALSMAVPYETPSASLSLQVPAGAQVSTTTAGLVPEQPGPQGSYYTLRKSGLKGGEKLEASLTYTGGTTASPGGTAGGLGGTGGSGAPGRTQGGSRTAPVVVLLIFAGLAGVAAYAIMAKARGRVGDREADDGAQAVPSRRRPAVVTADSEEDDGYFDDEPRAEETPAETPKPARKAASSAGSTRKRAAGGGKKAGV